MSAATIDRLLQPCRFRYPKRLCGTKPGSLLKQHVEVKTNQWREDRPGFMEADTVAHCGTSLLGSFIWSITLTDIYSGWTENAAVWNKGAEGVLSQIELIESHLPFPILGFDCDNGSEFLNHHLIRYLQKREKPVQFTRSRPYHKGDNAHVEPGKLAPIAGRSSHRNRTCGYNNVANNLEFVQIISRAFIRNSPGKKYSYESNVLVNSSWQIICSKIDK